MWTPDNRYTVCADRIYYSSDKIYHGAGVMRNDCQNQFGYSSMELEKIKEAQGFPTTC